jgi:alpha-tubulin suppressor-like RCC1 family protein
MKRKILLAGLIIASVCAVSPLAASASTPKPTIIRISPTSGNAGSEVTITGTNLEGAIKVTFHGKVARMTSDKPTKIKAQVPGAASTGYIEVETAGGTAKSTTKFTVGLDSSSMNATPSSSGIGIGSDNSDSAVVKGNTTRGNPTGTVTFYECGPTVTPEPCTSEANPLGSPVGVTAVSGDTSSASSMSFTASSTGYWCLAAYYSGDSNYEASSDAASNECFDVYVPLDDTTSVVSDSTDDYCAKLNSSGVDCWGYGADGELGNGAFSNSANPVAVKGVGGTGALTGVASLVGGSGNYCALLISGEVDCWGGNTYGELGNGTFSNSANPVAVEGVGGTGTLTGVTSLVGGSGNYCVLLTSSGVDCWGYGEQGQLGNGTFYTSASYGSDTPVAVQGVGGTGTLTGVTDLIGGDQFQFSFATDESPEYGNYCALFTSSSVDCWGYGGYGELGNGIDYTACDYGSGNCGSDTPVVVEGVGGTGTLTGVASLASDAYSLCALLTSGAVDCWGSGDDGELGNGSPGTDTPEVVDGVGGTGTLTGVASLVGDGDFAGYCALLTSGGVDCWGYGFYGDLGNGSTLSSYTPVAVEGVGGTGTLTGVTSLVGDFQGYCALLTSGGVDCWGDGETGELGNGTFYTSSSYGSDTPVAVEGVGGTGTLTGVTSLVGGYLSYCALLTSSGVDCWGYGNAGALGDGWYYANRNNGSATPVQVG